MVRRNSLRTTSATLTYTTVQASRLTKLGCPGCRATLEILQPNPADPDQFLAICPDCRAWFRVETRAGEARAVIVSIPEAPPLGPGAEPIPSPMA